MPTYDYVCDGCGHAFELFQSMTDGVKKTCPECGKKKLRRLIGAGGAIVFKGSGFYKTDYRSDSYKKGAAADSGGGGKPADKGGGPGSGNKGSGGDHSGGQGSGGKGAE
ncbi:MAG: zinc ribbon domain-containing protein [Planctomycetia bacterium]|nr:zinc ribbon domain-containing protein [Planctomycetia bacterium]